MDENIVERMSDEEQRAFVEIVINIINEVCKFADNFNYDRDNIFAYLVNRLTAYSPFVILSEFQVEDEK
nr:MAG TPA: hypothetical protein [Caudoviricetes sp.]